MSRRVEVPRPPRRPARRFRFAAALAAGALALAATAGPAAARDPRAAPGRAAASARPPAAPAGERRPNLVVVSVDTLSRDALRAYSAAAPPLPVLDALAERSAVFTRAVSTAAWTLPAHGSLFTGLYPDRHGATDSRVGLRKNVPVLAELLAAGGYETVAFTDDGFVGAHFGFGRGFGRFNELVTDPRTAVALPRDGRSSSLHGGGAAFDRGVAYLRARPGGERPLFLFLHTFALHEYFRTGGPAAAPAEEPFLACLLGGRTCTPEQWEALRGRYAGELRRIDTALGELLGAVDAALAGGPTVLIVLSDHGEGLSPETGVVHHGGNLDPAVVRIPLLVHGPGIAAGRSDAPVSLVDVLPTLLELAGSPAAPGLDGRSLAGELRRRGRWGRGEERTLLAFEHTFWWEDGQRRTTDGIRATPLSAAVAMADHWYVGDGHGDRCVAFEPSGPARRVGVRPELRQQSRELIRARRRLEVARVPLAPSPEVERQLKALGYL